MTCVRVIATRILVHAEQGSEADLLVQNGDEGIVRAAVEDVVERPRGSGVVRGSGGSGDKGVTGVIR